MKHEAAYVRNKSGRVLNYLSKLAAKGSKAGKYFFQSVMDFLTAQFLTFGRRMRKLLEAL